MSIPKGIKPVRKRLASGALRLYWYHRATGKRIAAEPGSVDALLEIRELNNEADKLSRVAADAKAVTFANLWKAYRESPEFQGLKQRTKNDYDAVRAYLGDAADKARPPAMTSADILKLRDKAFTAKGRRFGNYVVQVVRLVLEWGRPRGWLKGNPEGNPARGVKLIRKPKGERNLNRAWADDEVRAFLQHAPTHLKLPFALGLFCAMREGDVIGVTWRSYDGAAVRWIANKNDESCMAPVTGVLKSLLEEAYPTRQTVQMCISSHKRPWKSENSFRSAFFTAVRELQAAGKIKPGATFHGLRHTVGTNARNDGQSDSRVAAAIGDRSTAMAEVYGRDADRQAAQTSVLEGVQRRFEGAKLTADSVSKPDLSG